MARKLHESTNHILSALDCALQYPPNLFRSYSCVERVKWDYVGSLGVERPSVDLEMPLVPGRDTALYNVRLGVR